MFTIHGLYTDARIHSNHEVEPEALAQIQSLIDSPTSLGSVVEIMPDVHAGAGCTIGTTMTIVDRICPNLVGVDIGCGMLVIPVVGEVDFAELDEAIHQHVPSGFRVHENAFGPVPDLHCLPALDKMPHLQRSLGTLGGGNHFIEVSEGSSGLYLIIHSGSRNLGTQVARFYQSWAEETCQEDVPKDLAFLTGQMMQWYLEDMGMVQEWASANRWAIAREIMYGSGIQLNEAGAFETIHNYIDLDAMILRKGSVAAGYGERLVIPMNMRDGTLLCEGRGNSEWNYSAPHGAGRIMSRGRARRELDMNQFRADMSGIYTTSVVKSTIDEAPRAYKPMDWITDVIEDTAHVIDVLHPVYNYKAH